MTLGLDLSTPYNIVPDEMVTTASELPGFSIERSFGIVQAACEMAFKGAGFGGLTVVGGGQLAELATQVLFDLRNAAGRKGANAIVGFAFAISGRELEKSVLAWGTAVQASTK